MHYFHLIFFFLAEPWNCCSLDAFVTRSISKSTLRKGRSLLLSNFKGMKHDIFFLSLWDATKLKQNWHIGRSKRILWRCSAIFGGIIYQKSLLSEDCWAVWFHISLIKSHFLTRCPLLWLTLGVWSCLWWLSGEIPEGILSWCCHMCTCSWSQHFYLWSIGLCQDLILSFILMQCGMVQSTS